MSSAAARRNIFSVPPGAAFLDVLAQAVLAGELPKPAGIPPATMDLPGITILLPTRRAARGLQEAFLRQSGGKAMLLPAIRPISEGDEVRSLIESADATAFAGDAELPPAVGELERRLELARLVLAWVERRRGDAVPGNPSDGLAPPVGAGFATPAQALQLATDLATLVDLVETEGVTLDRIAELVPEELSAHWQETVAFLSIVTQYWPARLKELGRLSPADRRNRVIGGEAARLARRPLQAPVIVAGITGSIPATVELIRAVLADPAGAVVLPGLDLTLDEASLRALAERHPEHPQRGLYKLLAALGVARDEVRQIGDGMVPPDRTDRALLVSEALRPAGAMHGWRSLADRLGQARIEQALAGLGLVTVPTAQDEAEVVALILRDAAETPGRTAALVSPDRLLARRVATRLEAWGIRVDDSAGRPFAKTMPGTFLELITNAVQSRLAPAPLMGLLKHPLTRLGLEAGVVRRAARVLEIAVFRMPYLGQGIAGIAAALDRAELDTGDGSRRGRAVRGLARPDWEAARDLLGRLGSALGPLASVFDAHERVSLRRLVEQHIEAAEAVAAPAAVAESDDAAPSPLWLGDAGEAGALLMAGLIDPDAPTLEIAPRDYPDLVRGLVGNENVRQRIPVHPRLSIWGPYEARLQQPDVVVLGGLNDGTWPKAADPGAWLNRPMRSALGLPAPEEATGREAHDVTCLLGAETVVMTRAEKVDGAPTVPSRWLLRLEVLLSAIGASDGLAASRPWAGWAAQRNAIDQRTRITPPSPRPALHLRPRRASVSDVETWIANPYALFARRVLGLEVMAPLGTRPGPSERGQIVHAALSRFTRRHPAMLPDDVADQLMDEVRAVLRDLSDDARVRAFWVPRLRRFAEWFAETEPTRRAGEAIVSAEVEGRLVIEAPGGPFTLTARADRIDRRGSDLVIIDYKTGILPAARAVLAGEAPQLPLEAAMAARGAFTGFAAGPVAGLGFVRATGGEPPGEDRAIKSKDGSVGDAAERALEGLGRLVGLYDDPATPYRAVRRPSFTYDYDDYALLARVAEWGGGDGEEGE